MFGRVRRSPQFGLDSGTDGIGGILGGIASVDRANLDRNTQFGRLDSGILDGTVTSVAKTATFDRANLGQSPKIGLDSGIGITNGTATVDRANLGQSPQIGLDSGIGIPNGTASVDRARDNETTGQAQNISKGLDGTGTAVIR